MAPDRGKAGPAAPAPCGRRKPWLAATAALAVAALALMAVACGSGEEAPSPTSVPPDDPKSMGVADAPLVIIEYADFQ